MYYYFKKILIAYAAMLLGMNRNNSDGIVGNSATIFSIFLSFVFLPLNPFLFIEVESTNLWATLLILTMTIPGLVAYLTFCGIIGNFKYQDKELLADYDHLGEDSKKRLNVIAWLSIPVCIIIFILSMRLIF